jgi:hypothetical protein
VGNSVLILRRSGLLRVSQAKAACRTYENRKIQYKTATHSSVTSKKCRWILEKRKKDRCVMRKGLCIEIGPIICKLGDKVISAVFMNNNHR